MKENSKDIFRIFGENIHYLRNERSMTLEELSVITGIRKEYLQKIENGVARRVSASHIFIFANAFNVEPLGIVKNL